MSYLSNEIDFQEICGVHELGEFQSVSTVEGGRIHCTYKVTTLQNNKVNYFALKVLNPILIETESEKNRFIITDTIARQFKKQGINSVPSRIGTINVLSRGNEEINYMVFDWIDGNTLSFDEIEEQHCRAVGMQLAQIHYGFPNTEENPYQNDMQGSYQFNFQTYLENSTLNNSIKRFLAENIDKINEILNKHAQVIPSLNQETQVMAHGDMDSTNTIWQGKTPFFVDWEKATAAISPSKDYMITAVYWSRRSLGKFSDSHFLAFWEGYKNFFENKNLPIPKINQKAGMLALLAHWLIWVDFNLKRASNSTLSEDQRKLAEQQIIKTLNSIFVAYNQYYGEDKLNNNANGTHIFPNRSSIFRLPRKPEERNTEIIFDESILTPLSTFNLS